MPPDSADGGLVGEAACRRETEDLAYFIISVSAFGHSCHRLVRLLRRANIERYDEGADAV